MTGGLLEQVKEKLAASREYADDGSIDSMIDDLQFALRFENVVLYVEKRRIQRIISGRIREIRRYLKGSGSGPLPEGGPPGLDTIHRLKNGLFWKASRAAANPARRIYSNLRRWAG